MQQPPTPTTTPNHHHPPWRGLGGSAGDSEIALPLRGPGGGTGQDSDLISQEGKEKGGVRWIRVRLSLYFTLFFPPVNGDLWYECHRGGVITHTKQIQA